MAAAFARLLLEARRNVTIRNDLVPARAEIRFEVMASLTEFTVLRHVDRPGGIRRGVHFRHDETTLTVTEGANGTPILTATLTLNDLGECRFKVDDAELKAWQVLRRALEALFFE